MYKAFKEMPLLLKFITIHALLCVVFFIIAVVPGIPINYEGNQIDSSELWKMGIGLPIATTSLAMTTIGLLLLNRWIYSRHIYSFLLVFMMLAPGILSGEFASIVFGTVFSGATVAYLFFSRKVRAYFGS